MMPKGWKEIYLSESLQKISGGGTPSRINKKYWSTKGIPWVTVKDMKSRIINDSQEYITEEGLNNSSANLIPAGTVIISTRMAVGRSIRSTKDVAINQDLKALITGNDLSNNYLHYLIESKQGHLNRLGTGSTVKGIVLSDLETLKVLLPPVEEQKKIAKILSTWDVAIEKLEKLIDAKKRRKKGLMQQLLTGKKRFPGFSEEWVEVHLENVCHITMGSSPSSSEYNDNREGLPLIQGNADIMNNRRISPKVYTRQITKTCDAGDIIMCVRAPVGEVALASQKSCIGRGVAAFKTKKEYRRNFIYFLLLYLEDYWGKYSQGSTFEAVNSKDIKSFKLFVPQELNEQKKIGFFFKKFEEDMTIMDERIIFFKNIKKGLMQQLLTGKKRVNN